MRIFIAFPVPESIRTAATQVARLVQRTYPQIEAKWSPVANMHVTLEFLGSITDKELQIVRECLAYQTKKIASFQYAVTGLVAFPNVHHPETIALAVGEKETTFSVLLRKAVHEELSLYNVSRDFKLWRPHITLCRVHNAGRVQVPGLAELPLPPMEWSVNKVEVIESTLSASGSQYKVRETFLLA